MMPDVSVGGPAGRADVVAGVLPGVMAGVIIVAVGLDRAVRLSSAVGSDEAAAPACGGTNV